VATVGEGTAQGGTFDYFDDGGNQLRDSILGANEWFNDLGNGNAQEWVGWLVAEPTITFTFSSSVTINRVEIGFNRSQPSAIFLPATVRIGGVPFTLAGSELPDTTRGFLTFSGTFTGISLTIELLDMSTARWIFTDEFRFFDDNGTPPPGDPVIPEASTMILLGCGLVLMGLLRPLRHR
jgi:hypothetical protein